MKATHDETDLSPGVIDFYSAQADLVLTQFENINHLLGPTADWTHPGFLCEELLREFLRRNLPPGMAVDKGFIYGRAKRKGTSVHCPEIDILIHNSNEYTPIYRLGDFVIVKPEAVLGIIQVKRSLDGKQLRRGLENVILVKQHLADLAYSKEHPESCGPNVFSGIVGLVHTLSRNSKVFPRSLSTWYKERQKYNWIGKEATHSYVLPNFICSLKGKSGKKANGFFLSSNTNHRLREYLVYDTIYGGKNIALQALLVMFLRTIFHNQEAQPPFAFPSMELVDRFTISSEKANGVNAAP